MRQTLTLPERIRVAREAAGLSQLELAVRVGLNVRTIQRYEKHPIPGVVHLARIAVVTFHVPEFFVADLPEVRQ